MRRNNDTDMDLKQARKMVKEDNREKRNKAGKWILGFLKSKIGKAVVIVLVLVILGGAGFATYQRNFSTENKSTDLGLKNIGELATQEAVVTQVHVDDTDKETWGIHWPFTQTKYIFSYDVRIKAGYNFEDINCVPNDETKIIACTMPESPKILSKELDTNSFKVYHEKESIFNRVSLEENNKALQELEKTAVQTALDNGLYKNAENNAKTILEAFLSGIYNLDEYKVEYKTTK